MRPISGKELARLLERHGWALLRIHADIYRKPGSAVRLSVPVRGNKPLKTGLLKHLLKMAGLEDSPIE
jgi:predicted RNA binding protein YcfA (HicA-like mRNA interferase family)